MNRQKLENHKSIPSPVKSSGRTFSISKVTLFVLSALIVGFIGGIWFADNAHNQLSNPVINVSANPGMTMDVTQKETMPGPVNMDASQAIVKMEEILKSDPNNVELLIHLGDLYYNVHNPEKAVATYERALALDPKNPDVLTDCGSMYRELKNYDKCLAYYKQAAQISPQHYQSWFNMGITYRDDLKQYQKAIDAWNQLLANNPNSPNAAQVRDEIQKTRALL